MMGNDTVRLSQKNELWQRLQALDMQQALFPSPQPQIDEIVKQLESINPISKPLSVNHQADLSGNWQLVYASRGTVITRPLATSNFWGGIKINRVWQTLVVNNTKNISTVNAAELELPLLGKWKLWADGVWTWEDDEQLAKVSFHRFGVQPINMFGISGLTLPELKVPVLEAWRREAVWITSYLDEDMRVGRGVTGNLFVFRRE